MEPWEEEKRRGFRRRIAIVRFIAGSIAGLLLSALPVYYSILTPLTWVEWLLFLAIAVGGGIVVAEVAERVMRWSNGRR